VPFSQIPSRLGQIGSTEVWISHRFASARTYLFGLVALCVGLTYLYRTGGFVDGFDSAANHSSLRDYGVWVRAGQNLWAGIDPYAADGILKSGVFSSQIIFLTYNIFPNPLYFFLAMQLLNLAGLLFFMWQNKFLRVEFTFVAYAMLTFSSTREILVNGQTTGLIMGVFAILQKFLVHTGSFDKSGIRESLLKTSTNIACGIGIFFILDLKPNIGFFPILILLIIFRKSSAFLFGIVMWGLNLLIFSVKTESNLIASWAINLSKVTNFEDNANLFGSLGFWQIVNELTLPSLVIEILPVGTFILVGILAISLARNNNYESALFLAFLSNYFYSYFHFYSYFPILAFILIRLIRNNSVFLLGVVISSMEFSFNENVQVTSVASLLLLMLIIIFFRFETTTQTLNFTFGWCLSIVFKGLLSFQFGLSSLECRSLIVLVPTLAYVMSLAKAHSSIRKLGL
jgi:hypothetical protein